VARCLTGFCLAFSYIVKCGIVAGYRLRSTFGAETTFTMTDKGVEITGPGAGRFLWSVYERVALPDGVTLVRKCGIRWLPGARCLNGVTSTNRPLWGLRIQGQWRITAGKNLCSYEENSLEVKGARIQA
jgi:hypothetical protein